MNPISKTTKMALRILCKPSNKLQEFIRRFSSETKLVAVDVNDKSGVATLTMNRAPVNSLNLELISDINAALTQLEKNKCRGLILTSASNKVFSAGLDILELYKPDPHRLKKFWTALQDLWITLYGTSFPTVAVINGHAPAGGCLLSMCCEYRVMVNNFTIGLNETQLGMVAPMWFISTMKNVIGHRQAEAALTMGRLFSTEEAMKIGLVDEVASTAQEATQKAESFISKFARIPPVARAVTKQCVREETIQNMVKDRENDLNKLVNYVANDAMQKVLGMYFESLKQKAAK